MHPVLILIAAKALGIGAYSAWKKGRAKRLLRAGRRERAPRRKLKSRAPARIREKAPGKCLIWPRLTCPGTPVRAAFPSDLLQGRPF